MNCKRNKGYTLIELLLAISLVLIIAGFSIPVTNSYLRQNELNIAFRVIASSIRKANIYSTTGFHDSVWGFRIGQGNITVFNGNTYATRNSQFDEISSIPSAVNISGINESFFAKVTGVPAITGNITLNNPTGNRVITLNSRGFITY
jgi:prepilin-type N-terminal cleavage/methylation domain-containing protein